MDQSNTKSSAPNQIGDAPSDLDIASKFGSAATARYSAASSNTISQTASQQPSSSDSTQKPKKKRDKPKDAMPPPASNQPMILVTVNDRLGTKAQIPCLASDTDPFDTCCRMI